MPITRERNEETSHDVLHPSGDSPALARGPMIRSVASDASQSIGESMATATHTTKPSVTLRAAKAGSTLAIAHTQALGSGNR